MNRRGFVGVLTAAAAAGLSAVPEPSPVGRVTIEPLPTAFGFESVGAYDCDASVFTVAQALGLLGWDSADPVKPLLCVHPTWYPQALEVAIELNSKIAIWASPFSDNRDTWFVAWRGRRVGSAGA